MHMPNGQEELKPAIPAEIADALAHALLNGRKPFEQGRSAMAKIIAEHLAACLKQPGVFVMKKARRQAAKGFPGRS